MTEATTPSSPRWMRITLGLSLALNLAVLGVVGGALLRDHDRGPRPAQVRDLGFGPFSDALSPEDSKALREAFLAVGPDFRAARRDMRNDLAQVLATLRADPFEPDAFRTVLERQSTRGAEMLELGQTLLAERVALMSAEARRAFADRLEASLTRGPDRRKGDDPRRP